MLMRSMIGSLAAVGVIGALAAALPERNASRKPAPSPSFGALPRTPVAASPAAQDDATETEKQSLIKLAAYASPRADATSPTSAAVPQSAAASDDPPGPAPARSVRPVGPAGADAPTKVASAAGVPEAPAAPITFAPPMPRQPVAPVVPAQAGPQTLAALPPTLASTPQPASKTGGRVNINHASVAELDHLPGGGRIGFAIARRRPYGTVDDLVRKRVLRASLLARIRTAITVD